MTRNSTPHEQRDLRDLSVYEPSQGDVSPFVAFLECTDEKERVAEYLGLAIAAQLNGRDGGRILDIGAGDGSLVLSAISASGIPVGRLAYDAVEPVAFNAEQARTNMTSLALPGTVHACTFQEFTPQTQYDVVVASNLYYLATDEIPAFVRQAKALAPNGKLIFIYRDDGDDLFDFRDRFEAPLYQSYRRPRAISDVLAVCNTEGLSPDAIANVEATLRFPEDRQLSDRVIEFIFNRPPEELPDGYLAAIYDYLQGRGHKLVTRQAILTFEQ